MHVCRLSDGRGYSEESLCIITGPVLGEDWAAPRRRGGSVDAIDARESRASGGTSVPSAAAGQGRAGTGHCCCAFCACVPSIAVASRMCRCDMCMKATISRKHAASSQRSPNSTTRGPLFGGGPGFNGSHCTQQIPASTTHIKCCTHPEAAQESRM